MELTTLVTRGTGLVAGELVGLDVGVGKCYGFNATATRVWRLLDAPQTLCDQIVADHDVDNDRCLADVGATVRALADDGLVSLTAPR